MDQSGGKGSERESGRLTAKSGMRAGDSERQRSSSSSRSSSKSVGLSLQKVEVERKKCFALADLEKKVNMVLNGHRNHKAY